MSRTQVIFLIILIPVVLLSWWLVQESDEIQKPKKVDDHKADYYIENFKSTLIDEAGKPSHELYGKKLIHYMDDDSIEITNPLIKIHNKENGFFWKITALSGKITNHDEMVLLSGETVIEKMGQNVKPVKITTSDVIYRPGLHFLQTDKHVLIESLKGQLTAIGMKAIVKIPYYIELKQQVRGKYVP